jgi:hypothetical protein
VSHTLEAQGTPFPCSRQPDPFSPEEDTLPSFLEPARLGRIKT